MYNLPKNFRARSIVVKRYQKTHPFYLKPHQEIYDHFHAVFKRKCKHFTMQNTRLDQIDEKKKKKNTQKQAIIYNADAVQTLYLK